VSRETKTDAGRRFLALPEFMRKDLVRNLAWYGEKKPNRLLFVGGEECASPALDVRTKMAKGPRRSGAAR